MHALIVRIRHGLSLAGKSYMAELGKNPGRTLAISCGVTAAITGSLVFALSNDRSEYSVNVGTQKGGYNE